MHLLSKENNLNYTHEISLKNSMVMYMTKLHMSKIDTLFIMGA
jgi:hypothetical protein